MKPHWIGLSVLLVLTQVSTTLAQVVGRDHRWPPRGPWMWAVEKNLPALYREFNGIDFGHAHLAETLLRTQKQDEVEKARVEVLDFIFSSPAVPPDEEQISPTFARMTWEIQKTFDWAHTFHRSLYDLFAADEVRNKESIYRELLANYLSKPEAITPHHLDHMGKLWSFPESKSFRDKFPKFNVQIWAYHWLQGATYDVQLMGSVERQRDLFVPIIQHYHDYLRNPPLEWEHMPMFLEVAPEFALEFPEAAAIFDNLHMLHDNVDDILSRPDLYATTEAKRDAILRIHDLYLHKNHGVSDRYVDYHMPHEQMQKMEEMAKMKLSGEHQMKAAGATKEKHSGHQSEGKTDHSGKQHSENPPAKPHENSHGKNIDADLKKHDYHESGEHQQKESSSIHLKQNATNNQTQAHKDHQVQGHEMHNMGNRPPSAREVLQRMVPEKMQHYETEKTKAPSHDHKH